MQIMPRPSMTSAPGAGTLAATATIAPLRARDVLAAHQARQKIFEGYIRHKCHNLRKFANSFFPSVVMIDSG